MGNNNERIWVKRINDRLEHLDKTMKDLAIGINSSPSTVSAWLSDKTQQEPKIVGFHAAAEYLGVTMDYLFGADMCTTAEKEAIYKVTGLSDKAITQLAQEHEAVKARDSSAEKRMAVCNYLIEAMGNSSFFEDMYNYLFGEFCFENENGEYTEGAQIVASKSPSGKLTKSLAFDSVFSHAHLAMVYRDIALMKDMAEKSAEQREEAEYKDWTNSDEGKAVNNEFYGMLYGGNKEGEDK